MFDSVGNLGALYCVACNRGVQGNECEAESNGNHQSYAVSVNGIPIKGYGL